MDVIINMSEPRIPYGVDPYGRYVHIEEAEHKVHYYKCPVCEEFLQPRQGDVYIWYFAHDPASVDSPSCELRIGAWIVEFISKAKIPPIQQLEAERKLRLLIKVHPYIKNQLDLFGLLPCSNIEDFPDSTKIDNTLKNLKIQGDCIKKIITPNYFHPSEGPVAIPLDVNSEKFEILISSNPSIKSIDGIWHSNGIQPNNIFIGDSKEAIKFESDPRNLDKGIRIKKGDYIFLIFSNQLSHMPDYCKTFNLGKFFVLSFEFNENTQLLASKYIPSIELDKEAFSLDLILPPEVEPNPILPIGGPPNSEALIAIIPPKNRDPTFEVVTIPLDKEKDVKIESTGVGKPRFYFTTFPQKGSRRLSIHWGVKHKDLNLHPILGDSKDAHIWKNEKPIGIKILNEIYIPYVENLNPIVYTFPITKKSIDLEFLCPDEMMIDIEGMLLQKNLEGILKEDNKKIIRECIPAKECKSIIQDWINNKINRILISFGTLGTIELQFKNAFDLTDEEIKARILEMKELPERANWKLVKAIYKLNGNFSKELIPGGKKRIRHILMKIRREKILTL